MDYSDLDMDACIRAMEHNTMLSSSSFVTGSPLTETNEIDQMEEDSPSPSVALPEESVVPTSLEYPNTSTSLIFPTGKNGDKSSVL